MEIRNKQRLSTLHIKNRKTNLLLTVIVSILKLDALNLSQEKKRKLI